MPELPEVELAARSLRGWCVGHTIVSALARGGSPLRGISAPALKAGLAGRQVQAVYRHGKQLFIRLSGAEVLLVHLGMTGRFTRHAAPGLELRLGPPRERMRWMLDDGSQIAFTDPRRFGRIRLLPASRAAAHPEVARLGPDAYRLGQDPAAFAAALRVSRSPIKIALLDQSRLAGVGNIYASEALFRARIDPRTPARKLAQPAAVRLAAGLVEAMDSTFALEAEGELRYQREPGSTNRFLVYDRRGEPCSVCGTAIRREVQGGRSTFWCPRCQRPARSRR
jgi:formamidopyrimidine-DNA glycosylase